MTKKSNSDSGLTAKRSNRLLAAGLTALAVSMASCHTTRAPLDDAYYQPEKTQSTSITPNTPNTPNTPTSPTSIEYLNVQDTTVTIRIKK